MKDGVVFAVQKLVTSKLHERGTNRRLFTVDQHVGVVSVGWVHAQLISTINSMCVHVCMCVCVMYVFQATAGLLADARNVVDRAKDEASSYRGVYSEAIPVKVSSLVSMLG